MNLPSITPTQLKILLLTYKFRFLDTKHFQTLLGHKDPRRIQEWLKDLMEKKCLGRIYERKVFGENTKPAVYYLGSNGRMLLKDHKACDLDQLDKVYKERTRTKKFINRCLILVDLYIFFLLQKSPDEELHFFTKGMLGKFDHFPDPLPDAYMAVKNLEKTKRYFLDFFDEYTPYFIMRRRIKEYIAYSQSGTWEAKTHSSLPSVFLIFSSENTKKHIYAYSKSLLDKSFNDTLVLYLTTKEKILAKEKPANIWERVV